MQQPFDRMSVEMVRLLPGQIAGEEPATVTQPTTLIERDST